MTKRSLVLLIIIFFSVSFSGTATAKEKKTGSKQKKKVEVVDTTPLVPFDPTVDKLLPNYKGTDIIKLYSSLGKKAPLKKEEFETTADYEKKIAAAVSADIYAFKIDVGSGLHGLRIKPYDADSQQFQITLETEYLSRYTFEDYRASFINKLPPTSSVVFLGNNNS